MKLSKLVILSVLMLLIGCVYIVDATSVLSNPNLAFYLPANLSVTQDFSPTANSIINNGATLDNTNYKFGGGSLGLSGSGKYLDLYPKDNLKFLHAVGTSGQWSIEFWYRSTSFAATQFLFDSSGGASGNTGVYGAITTDRHLHVNINYGTSGENIVALDTSALPNDANWHYVVITYDQSLASDNAKGYVDGGLIGTATKTAHTPSTGSSTFNFTVGSTAGAGASLIGNIDDMVILNNTIIDGTIVPTTEYLYSSPITVPSFTMNLQPTDGSSWTNIKQNAMIGNWSGGDATVMNNITYLVMGVNQTSNYLTSVWSTPDGVTWTLLNASAITPGRHANKVITYNNKLWTVAGFDGSGYDADVWSSTDGIIWTRVTASAAFGAIARPGFLSYDGKMWVIGGDRSGGTVLNTVYSSTDGVTWTLVNASCPWTARFGQGAVVFNNKMWIWGGVATESSTTSLTDVWYSTDGNIWTQATSDAGFGRYAANLVSFNGKMWTYGGSSGNAAPYTYFGDMHSSSDGVTWTPVTFSTTSPGNQTESAFVNVNNRLYLIGGVDVPGGLGLGGIWKNVVPSSTLITNTSTAAVEFSDTTTGSPIAWNWTARNVTGDNIPFVFSALQYPLYTFSTPGNYSISLSTLSSGAITNTSSQIAFVNVSATVPTVTFSTNVSSGVAPLSLYLNDTSTGSPPPTMWNTSWGDDAWTNQTSFPPTNITHTYSAAGSYTITEYVTNSYGTGSSTATIDVYSQTIPDFSANPTYGYAPQTVSFTNLSTGVITSWLWDFGDGDSTNSTQQNPLHTYTSAGTYTVSLTTSNPFFTNSTTKTNYITIDWKPFSGFTANNTAPIAYEQTVNFTLDVPNTANRYQWSFGDGSTFLSYNNSVEHLYTTTGGKTVSLTAYESTNTSATNTTTRINYINPTYNASLVLADFSGNPTSGSAGVAVTFTDLSVFGTNTGKTYNWSFGDNTYSSVVGNITHVYANYGTYTVTLEVNNTIGSSSMTKVNYIIVSTQTTNLIYNAQLYRLIFQNLMGTPLGNLSVDITPMNLTMQSSWTTQLIGISPQVNITNGIISGKTAADGTLGAPLLTPLGYSVHVYGTATSGDVVDYTIPEYPPSQGTDIVISLPTSVTGFITIKPTPSIINYNIYNQSISNTTNILSVNYHDPACTTNLTIVTAINQSGYILNTTTYTGSSACNVVNNVTYIQGVTSPPGDIIQYGLSAYVPNGGGWNNITETVGFNNGSSITGNATYDSWLAIILIVLISSAFTASTIYVGTIGVGLMGLFFYLSTKWFTPGVAGSTFVGLCIFWICIGAIGLITKRSRSVF